MKVFRITIPIYAESEDEAMMAQKALFDFVNAYREKNVAVTAKKISKAFNMLGNNVLVKTQIDNFLKY